MEAAALGLVTSHCLSFHPAALSLKGTPSICVNPWAAGDTAGNKHYHCWEWLDIDTASPYTHKNLSLQTVSVGGWARVGNREKEMEG